MKILAVNNFALNNINFESRNQRETNKQVHSTNFLKAIPVAVLVAMSPLNAPMMNAQQIRTEFMKYPDDSLTEEYYCKNATPAGLPGSVKTYMTRDGEEYAKLYISKEAPVFAVDKNHEVVEAVRNSTIEIMPESVLIQKVTTHFTKDGTQSVKRYFVSGSGIQYVSHIRDPKTGDMLSDRYKTMPREFEYETFEITEALYRTLTKTAGFDVPTTTENVAVFKTTK